MLTLASALVVALSESLDILRGTWLCEVVKGSGEEVLGGDVSLI